MPNALFLQVERHQKKANRKRLFKLCVKKKKKEVKWNDEFHLTGDVLKKGLMVDEPSNCNSPNCRKSKSKFNITLEKVIIRASLKK